MRPSTIHPEQAIAALAVVALAACRQSADIRIAVDGFTRTVVFEVCPPGTPVQDTAACGTAPLDEPGTLGIFIDDDSTALELHMFQDQPGPCDAVAIDFTGQPDDLDFTMHYTDDVGVTGIERCSRCGAPMACLQ